MSVIDAQGNVHENRTGQFTTKPAKPRGDIGKRQPAMDQPIDIRSTLDELPAKLVDSQQIRSRKLYKHDYKLIDGRKVFLVLPEDEDPPKHLDNSTESTFYEHRLILMSDPDPMGDEENIAVVIAILTYEPNKDPSERILGIQMRSRINDGIKLSPIDFGSLDSIYDDVTDMDLGYGDCNYNYLVERY